MTNREEAGALQRYIPMWSAAGLVVANIIGAGIFTSTGFQAADLGHPGWIFVLWIVGGVLALCGALCFAELGAAMPAAGAEYVYLRETYGRALGFMSAFISLTAGFSAPIASAAKSFVAYLTHFLPALADQPGLLAGLSVNDAIAIGIVWLLACIHLTGMKGGLRFNDAVTLFKVFGITAIIVLAFTIGKGQWSGLTEVSPRYEAMTAAGVATAMATSLIFVMFCYSGWNAAAYVAAEMKNAQRDLPRALLLGTGLVIVLYLLLNAVYFYGADVDELAGKVEVGLVASRGIFGETGVTMVTLVLLVSILASASAMMLVGPRVYYAFAADFPPVRFLARTGENTSAPYNAILLQAVVTSIIIVTGRVDQIQQYAGFTLALFSCLAVSCVIVLRVKQPELERPFKAWGYPFTPVLFLIVSGWMMVWAIRGRPLESFLSFLTVVVGGVLFYVFSRRESEGTKGT